MNECNEEFETVYLKNHTIPAPGACVLDSVFQPEWNDISSYCGRISLVWAVGGSEIQDFPLDLAYPIGGTTNKFKYFYIEMHYNNPQHVPSILIFLYLIKK
jgi:hypothetical protein